MTEADQSRDARHEEVSNKIATLEAMIVRLCQQKFSHWPITLPNKRTYNTWINASIGRIRLESTKKLNIIPLPRVSATKIQTSQRLYWMKIVSPHGTITSLNLEMMISRNHYESNTARVSHPLAASSITQQDSITAIAHTTLRMNKPHSK